MSKPDVGDVSYHYVLPVTALYFIVLFGCYPLQLQVLIAAICHHTDSDDCDSSSVSSQASMLSAYCDIASYAPTILLTGVYGSIANRYGRKICLIIPLVGLLVYVTASLFIAALKPAQFEIIAILSTLVMGICGGYSTFIMAIFSYTADCTALNLAERRNSYPITEGCIFLPKLVGPVCAGIWASYYGFVYPLALGVALCVIALIWSCCIPESLPLHSECRKAPLSLHPLRTFQNIAYLFQHKPKCGSSPLPLLSLAFCLYYTAYVGFAPVFVMYVKHVFNWGPDLIGYYDGADGGVHAFSMLFVPAMFTYAVGREFRLVSWIHAGYMVRVLYYAVIGLAPSTFLVFPALSLLLLSGPVAPYTRTVLSNTVPGDMQAQVFAAFSAVESISTLVSPAFSAVYSATSRAGAPESVFFLMSGCMIASAIMVAYIRLNPSLRCNLPDQSKGLLGGMKWSVDSIDVLNNLSWERVSLLSDPSLIGLKEDDSTIESEK